MQPEEIIQAKEWEQLSIEEKQVVAPLAATEGEYGMLKKMLLLAQEEAMSVPRISPQIQKQLQTQLPSKKPLTRRYIWYAAASVFILLLAGYFLLLPSKPNELAVTPKNKPVERVVPDSVKPTIEPTPPAVEENIVVAKPPKKKEHSSANPKQNKAIASQPAAPSVAVNDHLALLDLVTEVY